jgi:hypothetical protein
MRIDTDEGDRQRFIWASVPVFFLGSDLRCMHLPLPLDRVVAFLCAPIAQTMNKFSVLLLVVAVAGVSAININKLRSKTKGPDGSGCVALGGSCNTACDNGHWVRGLCPGAPVCCVPGAAPATAASAAPSTPAPSAPSGSGGKVCLTFDDGPFPITNDILQMMSQEGVKGTWFMK